MKLVALWCVALAVVALVLFLGARSPDNATADSAASDTVTEQEDAPNDRPTLSPESFNVALWTEPPAPPPTNTRVAQRTPPPPPIKLQLVAILTEPGDDSGPVYKAALYDPDADELTIVGAGEHLGSVEISDVTASTVALQSNNRQQRLSLDDAPQRGGRR